MSNFIASRYASIIENGSLESASSTPPAPYVVTTAVCVNASRSLLAPTKKPRIKARKTPCFLLPRKIVQKMNPKTTNTANQLIPPPLVVTTLSSLDK